MSDEGVIRKIDWTLEPEKIHLLTDEYIDDTRKKIDEIAKVSEGQEDLQTLLDFEESTSALAELVSPFNFMKNVSTDKDQRDACDDVEKKVRKFFNEVSSRKDVYDVLKRLDSVSQTFGPEEQMLLKKVLDDFVHNGAALDDDERKEFLEISNNITVLESDYNRVLNEITTTVPCTKEELEGVPPDVYENLEKEGDYYKLTLDYPVYIPVREYAKNPDTRKKMTLAFYNRGGKENSERLSDTLALRDRKAKLAGFANFADYNTSIKMAKNAKRVLDFMNDLKEKLTPLAEKELKAMKELKAKELGLFSNSARFLICRVLHV